jgi:hypothetical protein
MIAFLSQSLDNESPNVIAKDRRVLDISEQELRQKLVYEINSIVSEKTKVKDTNNVVFYRRKSKFVIEIIPVQRDVINRLSPVVAFGEFPENNEFSTPWVDDVCNQIEWFISEGVNRTLGSQTLPTIRNWLTEEIDAVKKNSLSRIPELMYLPIPVIMPPMLGLVLQSFFPHLALVKTGLIISVVILVVGSLAILLLENQRTRIR